MEEEQEKGQEQEDTQKYAEVSPCEHCGSDTHDDVVKAALWSRTGLIAIEDIPARVCEACGEQFYDKETAEKIEQLLADRAAKARREILVPVFSLADVEVSKRGSRPEVPDEMEMEAIQFAFTGVEQESQKAEESQERQDAPLCKYCGSNTSEDIVNSALWGNGGLVAIEDIPARVCQQCGEQFYDNETTQKILKLTEHDIPAEKRKREILVPVFSLVEVGQR